jgi:hypothetical protein
VEPLVDHVDLLLMPVLQVGAASQEGVSGLLQELLAVLVLLAAVQCHLGSAGLLHGVVGGLDQMELVVNDLGIGSGDTCLHGTIERVQEIHGDVVDRKQRFSPQALEPSLQRRLAMPWQDILDDPAHGVSNDRGEPTTAPRLLVHREAGGYRKTAVGPISLLGGKTTSNRMLCNATQRRLAGGKELGGTAARTHQHSIDSPRLELKSEARFWAGPRNRKLGYAMLVTPHPRDGALDDRGHLTGVQMTPAPRWCMVVDAAAGGLTGRTRVFLVSIDHTDKKLAKGLVEDHLGDLPRGFKAKKALVELSAVHERKLPPETQLKTALPTKFGVDPDLLVQCVPLDLGRHLLGSGVLDVLGALLELKNGLLELAVAQAWGLEIGVFLPHRQESTVVGSGGLG